MIRLASWIIFALVVTALIAWLLSLPGTMTIAVGGYIAQPRLGVAIFAVLMLIVVVIFVWAILRRIINLPAIVGRRGREKRRERGIDALSEAVIALHAGDPTTARQKAREARTHMPANAAAQLVEARAHLALGDMAAAREHYRALIGNEATALAALSGLHEQARTQGRHGAALTFARKAASIAPGTAWANTAVFDDLVRRGAWGEAVTMAEARPTATREEKNQRKRLIAVLETAQARALEPTDPSAALSHALAALKQQPEFVPAAVIAGRIEAHRGEVRKAQSLLRRVWRSTHHADVAALYAASQPGASAVERLKRARELVELPAPDRASAMVLARAAVDAYEWPTARNALAPYANAEPTQGVAMLLAEIEEGQNGDQGKAREWLARAVRAPRDPTWTADGVTATEWEPTSPVTGRLDAFEWKVPVSAVARPAEPPPTASGATATTNATAALPRP